MCKVELTATRILHTANQIYGVEVCSRLHKVHILGSNLARLGNLQRLCAIATIYPERTTAGLTLITHNAANTDRTIKHALEQLAIVILGQLNAELLLDKLCNRLKVSTANLQNLQILKCLLLQLKQQTSQRLLILYGIAATLVGCYVVNIFYEDDIGVNIVQILNQCTVTCRAEQELTLVCAERCIVGIYSDSVGRGLLHRERHIVLHAETLLVERLLRSEYLLEAVHMLGRYSEVDINLIARTRIQCTLNQMLLDSLTVAIGIGVERYQTLRFRAIAKTCLYY